MMQLGYFPVLFYCLEDIERFLCSLSLSQLLLFQDCFIYGPLGPVLKVHYLVYSHDTDYVPGVAYRDVQKIEIQFLTNF